MKGIKNVRLKGYNYNSNGYYFVTIVSRLRKDLFKGQEQLIEEELRDLIVKTSGFGLDYYVLMPNHIHLILTLADCRLPLGEIVRRLKAKVSRRLGKLVWQPNYYEHVIRSEEALNKIRKYVVNNPDKELLKFDEFYDGNSGPINRQATNQR